MDLSSFKESAAAEGTTANDGETPLSADRAKEGGPVVPGKNPPPLDAAAPPSEPTKDGKEPEKKEEKDSGSARFAALARKERGLVLKQQDFNAKQEAFRAEREAFEAEKQKMLQRIESYEKRKAEAKVNPAAWLEEAGLTYEDTTAFYLNDKKPTAELSVRSVEEKLEAFRREQQEEAAKRASAEKERAEAEAKAALDRFYVECSSFSEANSAEYPLVAKNGGGKLIADVIEAHFAETKAKGQPQILSPKEAAEQAEKYLEDQIVELAAIEKVQKRLSQSQQPKPDEKRPEGAQQRTLTNGMSASTPAYVASSLSEEDRIKRALAALDRKQ